MIRASILLTSGLAALTLAGNAAAAARRMRNLDFDSHSSYAERRCVLRSETIGCKNATRQPVPWAWIGFRKSLWPEDSRSHFKSAGSKLSGRKSDRALRVCLHNYLLLAATSNPNSA